VDEDEEEDEGADKKFKIIGTVENLTGVVVYYRSL
jgi:hypothetical protein